MKNWLNIVANNIVNYIMIISNNVRFLSKL